MTTPADTTVRFDIPAKILARVLLDALDVAMPFRPWIATRLSCGDWRLAVPPSESVRVARLVAGAWQR